MQANPASSGVADVVVPRTLTFVRLCARRTLPPDMRERLVALGNQLTDLEWAHIVDMARAERIASLVFLHVADAGLLPTMPVATVDALRQAYQTTLVSNRRMQTVQGELLDRLRERGIRILALKGLALTFRYYGELGLRPITDIDLLVGRADVPAVCEALREMGYHPSSGSGSPNGFNAQTHAVLDYLRERSPQIEVHWQLFNHAAYRNGLPATAVWERAEAIELLGARVSYLHPADELLYLSVHFAAEHHLSRLLWAVDIAELIRALPASWDWPAVVRQAIEAGLATPLGMTLAYCHDAFDLPLPPAILDALDVAAQTPVERALWQMAQARYPSAEWIRAQASVLQGPREWGIFLRGVLLPLPRALADLYGPTGVDPRRLPITYVAHAYQAARALISCLLRANDPTDDGEARTVIP